MTTVYSETLKTVEEAAELKAETDEENEEESSHSRKIRRMKSCD